jgi:hypothetical protein
MDEICAGCGKKIEEPSIRDSIGNRFHDMSCVQLHIDFIQATSQKPYSEAHPPRMTR